MAVLAVVVLSCFRLAHVQVLWADEDYHLAAAIQILHGKVPYRDFWYDKPPLSALYYLLIGGYAGRPLRMLDALYVMAACYLLYRLAREWWGEAEGLTAAVLLAFFMTFYLPSAVIPFAADALMLVPQLIAIYFAFRQWPAMAGMACGVAFFANPKAAFVGAVCALWLWPRVLRLSVAFAVTAGLGSLALWGVGAWPGYVEQVWLWGWQYAAGAPVVHPFGNAVARTVNWAGFHGALVLAAAFGLRWARREERWKLGGWIAISYAAVALGDRFAPHYFLQLLPALVLAAAYGVVAALRSNRRSMAQAVLGVTLAIPLFRFGPRYVELAFDTLRNREPHWADVAMDVDSRLAAEFINQHDRSGDTLLVWGYRPDVYVYTRLAPDGLFWDSQPLTGVAADRHLSATSAIYSGPARGNRERLIKTRPDWIVDGLGLLNPRLSPGMYPELREWLEGYELVDRTPLSLVYRRKGR